MKQPVFYDFEASSFDGCPIEVGWAFIDEATSNILSEAHLICPPSRWEIRQVWSPKAAKLHNIPLGELFKHGKAPYAVASRMNQALADREIFSDSAMDEEWLRQLFDAAGLDPTFLIRRTLADVLIKQQTVAKNISEETFAEILKQATRDAPRTHRAEADARYLAMLWKLASEYQEAS